MNDKIPVYECKIDENGETGIYAMSFVDEPANETSFVALKKQQAIKLSLDKQKQILTGVVLIPDQLIYRYDQKMGEYYLKFSATDIEKVAQKMMRTGLALDHTTHQHEEALAGNYLTEIWTVAHPEKDKAVVLGLGELPAGTLIASYKIENTDYWRDEVLTGHVRGFSLEGIFNLNSINMNKNFKQATQKTTKSRKLTAFGAALQKMGIPVVMETETEAATEDLVDEAAKDETESGAPFLIFTLADGNEVYVDKSGFCTLNGGEQMATGEHDLSDGNVIVIDTEGMLVVTQPEADSVEPATAAADLARVKAAKQRAKDFLAKNNPKEARIAALEKQIKELKKQPSTRKAEAAYFGSQNNSKPVEEMTHTEKMAAVIKSRRERLGK